MKNNKKPTLDLIPAPVTDYQGPNIPTLDELDGQPDLLKQMPNRWKKNAAILACVGLMAPLALSGCGAPAPNQPNLPYSNHYSNGNYDNDFIRDLQYVPFSYNDLEVRLHGGGAGFASYVVYLTEQEALNFIRYQLERAGLRFGDELPDITATVGFDGSSQYVGLDLFDDNHGVGVTFLDRWNSCIPFMGTGPHIADSVAERFSKEAGDVLVGVFYTFLAHAGIEGGYFCCCDDDEWNEPTDRDIRNAKLRARPIIEENLMEQAEQFIQLLEREGVL